MSAPAGANLTWYRPMRPRDPGDHERAATPLELLFDLSFVVAVAQAASGLHHALADGHVAAGIVGYISVFFAVWWAWVNFTWFASAHDTDDALYRTATFVQILGVLILAAGVPRAFDTGDFRAVTLGYAVMRTALVFQWLRAAQGDPARRHTARRYAAGISVSMLGWAALLVLSVPLRQPGFVLMVLVELAIPAWAELGARTTWHPRHIEERYGLFTIIVLGESILASTVAIQSALDSDAGLAGLAGLLVGTPLAVFAMWWIYFSKPREALALEPRQAFSWGYGHYVIFAAAAAFGAGVVVNVDVAGGEAAASALVAGAAVTVPVAVYVLSVWALHLRRHRTDRLHRVLFPGAAALVVAATFGSQPVLLTGLVVTALVLADVAAARAPR